MTHLDIKYKKSVPVTIYDKDLKIIDKSSPNSIDPINFFSLVAGSSLLNVDFSSEEIGDDNYIISGIIKQMSETVVRVVRLYKHKDGALVAETKSNIDGSFEFTVYDGESEYYVIAFDDEEGNVFNSVIASRIKPVPID